MIKNTKIILSKLCIILGISTWEANAVTWDYSTSPRLDATVVGGSDFNYTLDPTILGGERDIRMDWIGEGDESPSTVLGNSSLYPGEAFTIFVNRGASEETFVEYVWDGIDGSSNINYTGLGGVDLLSSYSGLSFTISADRPATDWTFYFYTDAFNFSTWSYQKPNMTVSSVVDFSPLFADFTASGTNGGADFSNIGAIRITNQGELASDTVLRHVQLTPVPEPSGILLVGAAAIAGILRRSRRELVFSIR